MQTIHQILLSGLAPNTAYHYRVISKDSAGNSAASSDFSLTTSGAQAGSPSISALSQYLEAESALISSPMLVSADVLASNGRYVSSSIANSGTVQFTFSVPETGSYSVWARVLATSIADDSFFVSLDNASDDIYDVTENYSSSWQWTKLNGRGGITSSAPRAINPRVLNLSAGSHTLVFKTREANSKLDRIFITRDSNAVPVGGPALSTSASFQRVLFSSAVSNATAIAFPPDGSGRVFVAEQGGQIAVLNSDGQRLSTFHSFSVNSFAENGLLGITFDPDFNTNRFVYVFYAASSKQTRVSRIQANTSNMNVSTGAETVILDNIVNIGGGCCHVGGGIHFDKNGYLLVATGDASSPGSSMVLTDYRGKILRIDKNTGGGAPTNPFYDGNPNSVTSRIWARGLRNPFTFTISKTSGKIYLNDVGDETYEEINDATIGGKNFGWPSCEGSFTHSVFGVHNSGNSPCSNSTFTNPIYAYLRGQRQGSIIGGAFYDDTSYPAAGNFGGGYFFGDFVQGFIKLYTPSGNVYNVTSVGSPVGMEVNPKDGLVYILARNSIHKITLSGGVNVAPVAVASANVTVGNPPLAVTFKGSDSSDPNGDSLTYAWNFGDGSSSSQINPVHTYSGNGIFNAVLTVTDTKGLSNASSPVKITTSDNQAPTAILTTNPANNGMFKAGDIITFSGTATDREDGVLGASSFIWRIDLVHGDSLNNHRHPTLLTTTNITNGSFRVPVILDHHNDFYYEIIMVAVDSAGASVEKIHKISPITSSLSFNTMPAGLNLKVDGTTFRTPQVLPSTAGSDRLIEAPSQSLNNVNHVFSSWSDGNTNNPRMIKTGIAIDAYVVVFRQAPIAKSDSGSNLASDSVQVNKENKASWLLSLISNLRANVIDVAGGLVLGIKNLIKDTLDFLVGLFN